MRALVRRSVAALYLYFNSYFLPHGLLLTHFLTPLWLLWLALNRWRWLLVTALVLTPFIVAHLVNGIDDPEQYVISLGLLLTSIVFGLRVAAWVRQHDEAIDVLRWMAISAFAVSLIAIPLLATPWAELLWSYDNVSANIYRIPRLTFLTYEASYLSTLLVPVWAWAFLRWVDRPDGAQLGWLLMASLPLVLSFSLGILSVLGLGAALILLRRARWVLRRAALAGPAAAALIALIVLVVTPNPLSQRLVNLLEGSDTSGNSRTYVSLQLGVEVAALRDEWWGAGLGQTKVIASEIIRAPQHILKGQTPRLPNATAETIATFGWIGLGVRLALQLWLFFGARVWRNDWQLLCFVVPFVFQFAGSYLGNIAEYVLWALAAQPLLPTLAESQNPAPNAVERALSLPSLQPN